MTYIDGNVVVYYKINGKEPPSNLLLLEMDHLLEDDKLHKLTLKFYNHDRRMADVKLQQFLRDGNEIEFSYGYVNDLSPKRLYEIKGHEGWKEIKVFAYPKVQNRDQSYNRTFGEKSSKQSLTYSQIAEGMAEEMGLDADIHPTSCPVKNAKQKGSNPKFLQQAAKKLNFSFGIEDGILTFKPRPFGDPADFAFVYKQGSGVGDILDFNPSQNSFQMPSSYDSVILDLVKGTPVTLGATNDTVERTLLGTGFSLVTSGAEGEEGGGSFKPPQTTKTVSSSGDT